MASLHRWAGVAALILLLAGCIPAPSAPAPSKAPIVGYVVGGESDSIAVGWLDVAACSQQPHSWADVAAYCDLSTLQPVVMSPEDITQYNRGDPYPHAANTPAPSYVDNGP